MLTSGLPGAAEPRARHDFVLAGLVVLALGAWYAAGVGPGFVLTSGDDFFYASAAVDLSEGASLIHHFDSRALASQYVPVNGVRGAYASKYPLGLSLLLVPFYLVGGYRGLFALGPLMAALGVVAVYHLAWQLTRHRSVALLAAALLATLPPMVSAAGGIGSDLPSATVMTAALICYVRHLQRPRVAMFGFFSLLAGASFLIRNPNALLFGAACVHQLVVHRGRLRGQAAAWGSGLLVFGAFVAIQIVVNLSTFDSLVGGYEREAHDRLSLAFVPHHLGLYLLMLCAVPPLGLVAMLVVIYQRHHEPRGIYLLFAALVLAFTALYSAWGRSLGFDYQRAFTGGIRFLLPVLPLLCVFFAVAALDSIASVRIRRVLIILCLVAQLGASGVLTVELWRYKERMAVHRDRIYAATAQGALVLGPREWSKLFFPHDGTGQERHYASFSLTMQEIVPGEELVRLVAAALRAGEPVYVLGSGSRQLSDETNAVAELRAHYRLAAILDESEPYELRVDQVQR